MQIFNFQPPRTSREQTITSPLFSLPRKPPGLCMDGFLELLLCAGRAGKVNLVKLKDLQPPLAGIPCRIISKGKSPEVHARQVGKPHRLA